MSEIIMQPVSSSMICAGGYDDENQQAVFRYTSGAEYAFSISFSEFESIMGAPSVGKALNKCGVRGMRL